jgi:hypothetical protein
LGGVAGNIAGMASSQVKVQSQQQPAVPAQALSLSQPSEADSRTLGSLTNAPKEYHNPAPNYSFHAHADTLQAVISDFHIGTVLMGGACLAGGCIGMQLGRASAQYEKNKDDDQD